jgi:hypothetical protein
MRLTFSSIVAVYLMMAIPISALEMSEIELKDGSVIFAEIVALEGNSYTLHSDTLGTFQVGRSEIVSIRQKGRQPSPAAGANGAAALANDQIKALQEKIVSNRDTLDKVLSLQDDPDIKAVLEDQEIMKAATSGDISALMNNPKFMKLLSKPELQEFGKQSLQ